MIFLKRIITETIENIESGAFGKEVDFADIAFVFPTRRAGLYFNKNILEEKRIKKPLLEPDIFSIEDFVENLSGKKFPDKLTLLFELYEIYKKISKKNHKNFYDFYPWGKYILSDFNDISQNIVGSEIFKELLEYSKFNNEEDAGLIGNYNDFIIIFEKLYSEFSNKLKRDNSSYYGLALKDLITEFQNGNEQADISRWKKIIFAGFNFLTKGEEKLISILKKSGRAIVYWDTDEYFLNDENNEAGSFFRNSKLFNNDSKWTDSIITNEKKTINIIGTPGRVGQAKITGKLLEKDIGLFEDIDPDKTAIILSDETLLFPVINSIPEDIKKLNVSMGSPIKHSSPYNFIFFMLNIMLEAENLGHFTNKTIKRVLLHPYIFDGNEDEILNFLKYISEKNKSHIYTEDLDKLSPDLKAAFYYEGWRSGIDGSQSHFEYIDYLIRIAKDQLIKKDASVDLEYLYEIYNLIRRIKDIFNNYKPNIPYKEIIKIIRDSFENAIIPFSGEPLVGLQILGMLETRALDFENIFILSVNEKIFPKDKSVQTLIPTEIRKLKGMSYYEKRDGIFAYYFYRLIKGAKNINLIYNTENDKLGKGERSRFIEQLRYEFKNINKKSILTEKLYTFKSELTEIKKIEVEKTDEILKKLKSRKFSASSINRYLFCELAFYFNYIADLKEPDTERDIFDSRNFGTIIHRILEKIYTRFIDKQVNEQDIEGIRNNVNKIIDEYFKNELKINNSDQGRNYINKSLIENLLKSFFENEKKYTPFTIKKLEEKFTNTVSIELDNGKTDLKLTGNIDRIDELNGNNGYIRVIDYKTGKVNSLSNIPDSNATTEEIIQKLRKSKEILQLSFYNYLLRGKNEFKDKTDIRYGIVFFKSLSKGTDLIHKAKDDYNIDKEAENILIKILQDIFDKNKKFTQTENKDNCRNCQYKDICLR